MTIISHGNTVCEFTCKKCGCHFTASKSDHRCESEKISEHPIGYGARRISLQNFIRLRCPECGDVVEETKNGTTTI